MATSVAIPTTVLAAGTPTDSPTVSPVAVASSVTFLIDRSVSGGLDASPGVTLTLDLYRFISGAWVFWGGASTIGGPRGLDRNNNPQTITSFTLPTESHPHKVTMTATGGSVTIGGGTSTFTVT